MGESNGIKQLRDKLPKGTRSVVAVKARSCCKFAMHSGTVISTFRGQSQNRDSRESARVFREHKRGLCDTHGSRCPYICTLISTRVGQVTV